VRPEILDRALTWELDGVVLLELPVEEIFGTGTGTDDR
jgi:hypothetical protein